MSKLEGKDDYWLIMASRFPTLKDELRLLRSIAAALPSTARGREITASEGQP